MLQIMFENIFTKTKLQAVMEVKGLMVVVFSKAGLLLVKSFATAKELKRWKIF